MVCHLDKVLEIIFNNGGISVPALQPPLKYLSYDYVATRNAYIDLKNLYKEEIENFIAVWAECEEQERNARIHYFLSQVDENKIHHYVLALAMFSPPEVYKSLCTVMAHVIPSRMWTRKQGRSAMNFVFDIFKAYYNKKITSVFNTEHLKRGMGLVLSMMIGLMYPKSGYTDYVYDPNWMIGMVILALPEAGAYYSPGITSPVVKYQRWQVAIPVIIQFWLDNTDAITSGLTNHFFGYLLTFLRNNRELIAKKIKKTPAEVGKMLDFYAETRRFELPPPKPKERISLLK